MKFCLIASVAFILLSLPSVAEAGPLYVSAQSGSQAVSQIFDSAGEVAATDGISHGYAAGNVGAGTLTVGNSSPNAAVNGSADGAGGTARISDVLHFSINGATQTTVTLLTFELQLKGNYILDNGAFEEDLGLSLGTSSVHQIISQYHDSALASSVSQNGLLSYQILQNTLHSFDFIGTYALAGANPDLQIGYVLAGVSSDGFFGNFSSTFGILAPDGSTFTSDSGSRYPQVPEPEGMPIFATSLIALAIALASRNGKRPRTGRPILADLQHFAE